MLICFFGTLAQPSNLIRNLPKPSEFSISKGRYPSELKAQSRSIARPVEWLSLSLFLFSSCVLTPVNQFFLSFDKPTATLPNHSTRSWSITNKIRLVSKLRRQGMPSQHWEDVSTIALWYHNTVWVPKGPINKGSLRKEASHRNVDFRATRPILAWMERREDNVLVLTGKSAAEKGTLALL